jgi:hypothetical protein
MDDFDNFLALILFFIFLGVLFAGGFYMGYCYRDNLSFGRQKKYRPTQPRETSRVTASSAASSVETTESPTA